MKILAHHLGADEMRRQVKVEFAEIKKSGTLQVPAEELERIDAYFAPPAFETLPMHRRIRSGGEGRQGFRQLGEDQRHAAPRAGLCHRDDLAEDHRRRAGRCDADQMDALARSDGRFRHRRKSA